MSADDFVQIREVELGFYSIEYGFGDNPGREILYTDDLKLAIQTAQAQNAEYGIYFVFLADKE